LSSNTKKREEKTASSLGLLFNFIIIIVFIIIFAIVVGIVVPCPRVFYRGKGKRRIADGFRGLKAHRSAYFTLALL
jgi:hypothetical protein